MDHDPDRYDVVIAGGGPAGLQAALLLGRARKRVLLCDAGPARNASAARVHGFVTRDGTPPPEFRAIGRQQLARYSSLEVRDVRISAIDGDRGDFRVALDGGEVRTRSLLLCTGMVDQLPELPGFRALWGSSIFLCPYCHGWEVQDRVFGYLAPGPQWLEWSLLLLSWTRDVVVFTGGGFEVPASSRQVLAEAGIAIDERVIRGLIERDGQLEAVELDGGARVACGALLARPPQRQSDLVVSLGLACDELGFLAVDDCGETSRPGIYAGGDLVTPMQSAIIAASSGAMAAARLNHALTVAAATRLGW